MKQTNIQATGEASSLLEALQGEGFKLQNLSICFDDPGADGDDDIAYEYETSWWQLVVYPIGPYRFFLLHSAMLLYKYWFVEPPPSFCLRRGNNMYFECSNMDIVYNGHLLTVHQKYDIKDKALKRWVIDLDNLISFSSVSSHFNHVC